MSSALKPALTPSGSQNPPVSSQLNKPLHTQGAPSTYGQPSSHIPQNLVNIPHSAPTTGGLHSSTHNVAHHLSSNVHGTTHSANHYSINVPNASQHYPISGNVQVNTHSAPISNHPVPNTTQAHTQPAPTFSPSPKNLSYSSNYQASLYKTSSVTISQPTLMAETTSTGDKPQANGTPDIKVPAKSEKAQNHIVPTSKEKPLQPSQLPPPDIQTPVQEKAKTPPEQPAVNIENTKPEPPKLEESKPAELKDNNTVPPNIEEEEEDDEEFEVLESAVDSTDNSVNAVSSSNDNNCLSDLEPVTVITNDESSSLTEPSPTEVPEKSESQEDSSPTNSNSNKIKEQTNQKPPTVKVATTPRSPPKKPKIITKEASETPKSTKSDPKPPVQKSPNSGGKSKRTRIKTQPYQSPLPEVEMISKISATTPRSKNIEDKLIIFYKNEFLAVRNSEGGFYICQAVQNIYKSSPRIRIRWLSQDKNDKELYTPDFYDNTDFDCILTNLNLVRAGKGKYKLPPAEKIRTDSILKRALAVEKGDAKPTSLTEEHPDGLDLSLYKEESQLKKRKAVKRKAESPIETAPSNTSKSPDQPKVQKISPKLKAPPVKKATVLKKTLATKAKKGTVTSRIERSAKRQIAEPNRNSSKTSSIIDQKKAKVLAKVARKTVLPQPKTQPPPKQNNSKVTKPSVTSKKAPPTKKVSAAVTRKSKRGKK
ncbi:hypothetical protein FQR65_LT05601 [Abscondita terminalis]|nr:hypothetical protein FQR65_LT05601 [Abscondita terminalis]